MHVIIVYMELTACFAIFTSNSQLELIVLLCSLQMKQKTPSLCVVVDDSIFLAVALAHLAKGSHVLSLFPGLQEKGALYLQAVATANGYSKDHVEVQKMSELLTSQSSQEKVTNVTIFLLNLDHDCLLSLLTYFSMASQIWNFVCLTLYHFLANVDDLLFLSRLTC